VTDSAPESSPIGKQLYCCQAIEPDDVSPDTILDAFTKTLRRLEFHAETPGAAVDWNSLDLAVEQSSHEIHDGFGTLIHRKINGPFLMRLTVDVLEA
jgi:hypothetical protein